MRDLRCACVVILKSSELRFNPIKMPSWDEDEQDAADAVASEILCKAVAFAEEHGREHPTGHTEAFRQLLVAQHVKIQLAYLTKPAPLEERATRDRMASAMVALANAHANGGVKVKTAQPWHESV